MAPAAALETRGTHFRRQVPIGNYVVDFACMAARLVVEVDRSQHGEGENLIRDRERTRWLEAQGYRVLRFWNNEVVHDSRGVLRQSTRRSMVLTGLNRVS